MANDRDRDGTKPAAPSAAASALLEGETVKHLLSEEELVAFRQTVRDLYEAFDLNHSSDAMICVMCAVNFVLWHRALADADEDVAMKYRREVLVLLEAMKATRDKRDAAAIAMKSPAEWAAELLAKVREDEEEE